MSVTEHILNIRFLYVSHVFRTVIPGRSPLVVVIVGVGKPRPAQDHIVLRNVRSDKILRLCPGYTSPVYYIRIVANLLVRAYQVAIYYYYFHKRFRALNFMLYNHSLINEIPLGPAIYEYE
jgi:hypothetical protein